MKSRWIVLGGALLQVAAFLAHAAETNGQDAGKTSLGNCEPTDLPCLAKRALAESRNAATAAGKRAAAALPAAAQPGSETDPTPKTGGERPVTANPGPAPAPTHSGDAAVVAREGQTQKEQQLGQVTRAHNASIDYQIAAMEQAERRLAEMRRARSDHYQNDRALVHQAAADLEKNRRMPEPARARDREVRESLEHAKKGQELAREMEELNQRVLKEIGELTRLHQTNTRNAAGLGTLDQGALPARNPESSKAQAASAKDLKTGTPLQSRKGEAKGPAEESEPAGSSSDSGIGFDSEALRRALKARLKDKLSPKEQKELAALFEKDLMKEALPSGWFDQENDESKEAKDLSDLREAFSLAGAETDAEVRRMRAEAERALAALDEQQGILSADSLSLFERVREIHRDCLEKKCVLSPLPASG